MRNEEEIRTELGTAQEAYNAAVETQPAKVCAPLSDRVKALRKELCEALSVGASPCPYCGNAPIGLRHVHVTVPSMRTVFTYEVGCMSGPHTVDTGEKTPEGDVFLKTLTCRSQGGSVAEAVAEWNAGKYLPPKG